MLGQNLNKNSAKTIGISAKFSAKAILALTTISVLGGCISLLPKQGKPPVIAQLRAGDIRASETQVPFTISIGQPIMARAIAGERIAVAAENSGILYVDGLLLAAIAPISIQNVILDTFDKSMAFRAVVRGGTNSRADFEILFDVARFDVTQPKSRQDGSANIVITARLIDVTTRRPLAIRQFSANAPARRGDVTEPALALEAATRKISTEILAWAISSGLENQAKAALPAK